MHDSRYGIMTLSNNATIDFQLVRNGWRTDPNGQLGHGWWEVQWFRMNVPGIGLVSAFCTQLGVNTGDGIFKQGTVGTNADMRAMINEIMLLGFNNTHGFTFGAQGTQTRWNA